jgi:hypothetical protein
MSNTYTGRGGQHQRWSFVPSEKPLLLGPWARLRWVVVVLETCQQDHLLCPVVTHVLRTCLRYYETWRMYLWYLRKFLNVSRPSSNLTSDKLQGWCFGGAGARLGGTIARFFILVATNQNIKIPARTFYISDSTLNDKRLLFQILPNSRNI